MLNETWTDQYQRMLRSWKALQELGSPSDSPSEPSGRDALYHFCQDAFHLRDWIIKDSSLPGSGSAQRGQDLDTLFNSSSPALAACADLANGSKHLVRTRHSYISGERRTGHANLTGQGVTIQLPVATLEGTSGGSTQYHWIIEGDWDALEMAAQAVTDWKSWLTAHGLPV
ncbi:hypothetical protein [Nocardia wallacei]|uniref:hypothetical protein n=1 Tax=Nocardia wallacei TaxID=480035 RepID=UPI002455A6A4|nr:hypothetical protein [Nocardia wallacei]